MRASGWGVWGWAVRVCVLWVFVAAPSAARADFSGPVVAVVSGDVLEILREGRRERVHLPGVSCPSRRRPYGEAARQFTAAEALGKIVSVADRGRARGVLQGEVTLPGNRSLSQELVRNGWARCDRTPTVDPLLRTLEDTARATRRGLWAHEDSAPPAQEARRRAHRKR